MNKRLVRVIVGSISLLVLTFIGILAYDNYLRQQEHLNWLDPTKFSNYYWDFGYFKYDPKSVLPALKRGDKTALTPISKADALDLEEITNVAIYWTQADFLKIASAVGQLAWNDPLDLKEWSVYWISLTGYCEDSIGFDSATIVYFKPGSKRYVTRLIDIDPYFGWVRWGGGQTYPFPVLQKWKGVDLLESKISADDALRIACEDAKVRFRFNRFFGYMGSSRENRNNWDFQLLLSGQPDIGCVYYVNLDTGDYIIR